MLSVYDIVVIAIYLLLMVGIGWACRNLSKDASDYFRGGGRTLWWISGMSAFATMFTAYSFTAASAKVYETGFFLLLIYMINVPSGLLVYFFLADRFRQMRVITSCDAIRQRFGPLSEQIWVWLSVLTGLLNGGVSLYIISLFLGAAFEIPINGTILVLGVVVGAMAMSGGSWAVVISDFVQMMVVILISFFVAWRCFQLPEVGGVQGLWDKMPSSYTNFHEFEQPALWITFLVLTLFRNLLTSADLNNSGRKFFYCKDGADAKKSTLIAVVGSALLPLVAFAPIFACSVVDVDLAAMFPNLKNPLEGAYLYIASLVLPQGMVGLMLCSIFSATMSSMDTGLNNNSAFFVNNFYKVHIQPDASDEHMVKMGKRCTLFFSVCIMGIAIVFGLFREADLFTLLLKLNVLTMFPMVIPIALGVLYRKTPSWSAWATAAVSFVLGFWSQFYLDLNALGMMLGLEMPLNALEVKDFKYIASGIITFGGGISFFFLTTLFYDRESKAMKQSIDTLFENMRTPVVYEGNDRNSMDAVQYDIVGKVCLFLGGVLALGCLIPNVMNDRFVFIVFGALIAGFGWLLLCLSKKSFKSMALAAKSSALCLFIASAMGTEVNSLMAAQADSPWLGSSFDSEAEVLKVEGSGEITFSREHVLMGAGSLAWRADSGCSLRFKNISAISKANSAYAYAETFAMVPCFVVSIYSPQRQKGQLQLESYEWVDGVEQLMQRRIIQGDFVGWKTLWLPHVDEDREPSLSRIEISAKGPEPVSFSFDKMFFSHPVDRRHPYPDLHSDWPIVEFQKNDHWMPSPKRHQQLKAILKPTAQKQASTEVDLLCQVLEAEIFKARESLAKGALERFRSQLSKQGLSFGSLPKANLMLRTSKQFVLNDALIVEDPKFLKLRTLGQQCLLFAQGIRSMGEQDPSYQESIRTFEQIMGYVLDQGWREGNSLGTLHHLGYSFRELWESIFLMRDLLHEDLREELAWSGLWFTHVAGMLVEDEDIHSNIDEYNTILKSRIFSLCTLPSSYNRAQALGMLSEYLSKSLAQDGYHGIFKRDGTAWHHNGHYPDYAKGGFKSLCPLLYVLSKTSFSVAQSGYQNLAKALIALMDMSYGEHYGLGVSGRHPMGGEIGSLRRSIEQLAWVGLQGTDPELGHRLAVGAEQIWGGFKLKGLSKLFNNTHRSRVVAHQTYPYAALSVHRRPKFMATAKGYNQYVWSSEIYVLDNRYGRYQSNGVLQLLKAEQSYQEWYAEKGWDWNCPPGSTSVVLPWEQLEPADDLIMRKSNTPMAGGVKHGEYGVFGMILDESDGFTVDPIKREMNFKAKLKARKSHFFMGDHVVCLGSDISSVDGDHETVTTLYQVSSGFSEGRHERVQYNKGESVVDPMGFRYTFLMPAQLQFRQGEMSSPCNKYSVRRDLLSKKKKIKISKGKQAIATWMHGRAPKASSYAYLISLEDDKVHENRYRILQQNEQSHQIQDVETGMWAAAIYGSGQLNSPIVTSVSKPCLVMAEQNEQRLSLSLACPDLNARQSESKGLMIESPQPYEFSLVLKGAWRCLNSEVTYRELAGGTHLSFIVRDGQSVGLELEQKS